VGDAHAWSCKEAPYCQEGVCVLRVFPKSLLEDPERTVIRGLPGVAGRLYAKLFRGLTCLEDFNNLGLPPPLVGFGQDPEASGADRDVVCHRRSE